MQPLPPLSPSSPSTAPVFPPVLMLPPTHQAASSPLPVYKSSVAPGHPRIKGQPLLVGPSLGILGLDVLPCSFCMFGFCLGSPDSGCPTPCSPHMACPRKQLPAWEAFPDVPSRVGCPLSRTLMGELAPIWSPWAQHAACTERLPRSIR